jgi:hypothetical protein
LPLRRCPGLRFAYPGYDFAKLGCKKSASRERISFFPSPRARSAWRGGVRGGGIFYLLVCLRPHPGSHRFAMCADPPRRKRGEGKRCCLIFWIGRRVCLLASLRGANGSGPKWRPDDELHDEAIQPLSLFWIASLPLAMTARNQRSSGLTVRRPRTAARPLPMALRNGPGRNALRGARSSSSAGASGISTS